MKNLQELNKSEQVLLNGGIYGGRTGVVADETGRGCTDPRGPIKFPNSFPTNQQ